MAMRQFLFCAFIGAMILNLTGCKSEAVVAPPKTTTPFQGIVKDASQPGGIKGGATGAKD